jgi:hypothetical protein
VITSLAGQPTIGNFAAFVCITPSITPQIIKQLSSNLHGKRNKDDSLLQANGKIPN